VKNIAAVGQGEKRREIGRGRVARDPWRRDAAAVGGSGVEVEGFFNTRGTEIAEEEKRCFSTVQADTFAGSEREGKSSACFGRNDSWVLGLTGRGRAQTEVCATVWGGLFAVGAVGGWGAWLGATTQPLGVQLVLGVDDVNAEVAGG